MIKFAKENLKDYKNVFFYVNNGKDLRIFPDNKFDFVFLF
uniref:Class I SAM-dependent methyltransferase n=1 Tax=Fervidobacterium pennivorans TaxID=93466 RepID=A0A7V4KDY4_FERPE